MLSDDVKEFERCYIARCAISSKEPIVAFQVKEPIVAFQVNFICFDIWGQYMTTLSATYVNDFDIGEHSFSLAWRVRSFHEKREKHYVSIAYIARVRTRSGAIVTANTDKVVDVAREYMDDFTDDCLETDPPPEN